MAYVDFIIMNIYWQVRGILKKYINKWKKYKNICGSNEQIGNIGTRVHIRLASSGFEVLFGQLII